MTCIYAIKNIINGKMYIGSAVKFNLRKNMHLSQLKRNIHHSIKLQRSFNKYGLEKFEFIILEEVCKGNLISKEQYYIDLHASYKNGYNSQPIANSSLGVKRSKEFIRHNRERQIGIKQPKDLVAKRQVGLIKAYEDRGAEINDKRIASRKKQVESQPYCNFEWLNKEYTLNKKSIITMGGEIKKHPTTIKKWLIRFKIPVRSVEERNILISNKMKLIRRTK